MKNYRKLVFYTSKRSMNKSGYVTKATTELLANLKCISKMSITTVESTVDIHYIIEYYDYA
jgi:hypothetical protein